MKFTHNSATRLGFKMSLALTFILSMLGDVFSLGVSPLIIPLFHLDERNARWLSLAIAFVPVIIFCTYLRNHFPDSFKIKDRKPGNSASWLVSGLFIGTILFTGFLFSQQFWTAAERISLQNETNAFRLELQHIFVLPAIAMLLASDILAPVVEEFVYRGLLFCSIAHRTNSALAYLVSSFLFGCIHPSFHILTFVFGLCACALVQISGKLSPAIAMHITYNNLITWNALT